MANYPATANRGEHSYEDSAVSDKVQQVDRCLIRGCRKASEVDDCRWRPMALAEYELTVIAVECQQNALLDDGAP